MTVQQELQAVVDSGRVGALRYCLATNGFGAFSGDVAALSDYEAGRLCCALRTSGFGALADAVVSERAASIPAQEPVAQVETIAAGAGADTVQASAAPAPLAFTLRLPDADSVSSAEGADSQGQSL